MFHLLPRCAARSGRCALLPMSALKPIPLGISEYCEGSSIPSRLQVLPLRGLWAFFS